MVISVEVRNILAIENQMGRRKQSILAQADKLAPERDKWIVRNSYYYGEEARYLQRLIPPGKTVLEIGCGTGALLAALRPARGIGIDFSGAMIEVARRRHPELTFIHGDAEESATLAAIGEPVDFVVLADSFGLLDDCQGFLERLGQVIAPHTRLIIAYHNHLWEPVLWLGQAVGMKMPQVEESWLAERDVVNLLDLGGFDVIQTDRRQILPRRLLGLGTLVNRYIGTLPLIQCLGVRNYVVARLREEGVEDPPPSLTVIVPCQNERGNIAPLVERLPQICERMELVFVEGRSKDGTYEEMERVIATHPERSIRASRQDGTGKGDAVRKGVSLATGDIIMILDADMTVPPEDLFKFYRALASNRAEFVNGTRFVYPMEGGAMRFLNLLGNRAFSAIFSWLLNRRFTDTLCGTKALRKANWDAIIKDRDYFGVEDPFGDFDLILGSSRLLLKSIEIPVRYAERNYGETQISRFLHGWYLLRMAAVAYRKLKAD